MAKFDVHQDHRGSGYLLNCQSDLLSHLDTRFVVPLLTPQTAPSAASRLNPVFTIGSRPHVMVTQFAAGVPLTRLGSVIQSLKAEDTIITNALDMLLVGF